MLFAKPKQSAKTITLREFDHVSDFHISDVFEISDVFDRHFMGSVGDRITRRRNKPSRIKRIVESGRAVTR